MALVARPRRAGSARWRTCSSDYIPPPAGSGRPSPSCSARSRANHSGGLPAVQAAHGDRRSRDDRGATAGERAVARGMIGRAKDRVVRGGRPTREIKGKDRGNTCSPAAVPLGSRAEGGTSDDPHRPGPPARRVRPPRVSIRTSVSQRSRQQLRRISIRGRRGGTAFRRRRPGCTSWRRRPGGGRSRGTPSGRRRKGRVAPVGQREELPPITSMPACTLPASPVK